MPGGTAVSRRFRGAGMMPRVVWVSGPPSEWRPRQRKPILAVEEWPSAGDHRDRGYLLASTHGDGGVHDSAPPAPSRGGSTRWPAAPAPASGRRLGPDRQASGQTHPAPTRALAAGHAVESAVEQHLHHRNPTSRSLNHRQPAGKSPIRKQQWRSWIDQQPDRARLQRVTPERRFSPNPSRQQGMRASPHDGASRRSRFVTGATCLPGGYGYAVWSSRKAVTSDSRNLRWLRVSGLNRGRSTLSGRAVNG